MNEKQRFGGENGVAPGDVRHGAVDIISAGGLREGNRIEAKLARGGLPGSLWETYSAFANSEGMLTLCNPGCFRVPIATAKSGGVSDPRNATILKMFSLIDIGERSGHGIPMIDACWRARNWPESVLEEAYAPERTTVRLTMPMSERVAIKSSDKKVAIKCGDKKVAIKGVGIPLSAKGLEHWRKIAEYFAIHEYARASELAEVIGVKPARIRAFLGELCRKGLLIAEGVNKSRRYRRQRG